MLKEAFMFLAALNQLAFFKDEFQENALLASYCTALVTLHLENCIQLWDPQYNKGMDLLEQVQRRGMQFIIGLQHLSYENRQ